MDPQEPDDAKIDIADDVRELAGVFLAARHADLARLDAALAAGDFDTIRAVGHAFRGSSAPFGFPEAGRIGALIEEAAARADRDAVEALAPALRSSIPDDGSRRA
jgi:HPt (histidine-containing phosphotransfer) domain-containing protein